MYAQILSIIVRNWVFYLTLVLVSLGLSLLQETTGNSSSGGVGIFLTIYLAMLVQAAIIHSTTFRSITVHVPGFYKGMWRYSVKAIALAVIALILSSPVLIWQIAKPNGLDLRGMVFFLAAFMAVYSVLMSFLGTWPTSSITGVGTSLKDAWRRGIANFPGTFAHLFVSLIVMQMATALIGVVAVFYFTGDFIVDGAANIPAILLAALASLVQWVGITYAAVVLARVYTKSEAGSLPHALAPAGA
jgi:hypothetical protein